MRYGPLSEETKLKISISRSRKVESLCLNCGSKIIAAPSRKKKYCKRSCYREHNNKPGGFKVGQPNLYDMWVDKFGPEEADRREATKNKKLSAIHSEIVRHKDPQEMRARFGKDKTKGVSQLQRMINKYGEEDGLIRYKTSLEKISQAGIGRVFTQELREKIRVARIRGIESRIKKPLSPRYNPDACRFIESYGRAHGFNFRHAESEGGEHHIKIGFYLDGYDAQQNTVIEYYEKFHFDGLGNLKKRDQMREEAIIKHLNCSFIRINAFDINNIKIEKIA